MSFFYERAVIRVSAFAWWNFFRPIAIEPRRNSSQALAVRYIEKCIPYWHVMIRVCATDYSSDDYTTRVTWVLFKSLSFLEHPTLSFMSLFRSYSSQVVWSSQVRLTYNFSSSTRLLLTFTSCFSWSWIFQSSRPILTLCTRETNLSCHLIEC